MFALHFFFKTEQMCRNFFEFVSRNLTPGGYFVGCCPEGKAVLSLLAGQRKFTSQSLELIASDSTRRPECFGWGYTMAISRTVTAPSAEGLVTWLSGLSGSTHPHTYTTQHKTTPRSIKYILPMHGHIVYSHFPQLYLFLSDLIVFMCLGCLCSRD